MVSSTYSLEGTPTIMNKKPENLKKRNREVIRLEDLAPRARVKGGSGKLVFGERVDHPAEGDSAPETDTKRRPE